MTNHKITMTEYGGPEVLTLTEAPQPQPGPGEVRVRVQAAGVAAGDTLRRAGIIPGSTLPFTPGYDAVGVVDALGEGVTGLVAGQPVAGFIGQGGYAEYIAVPAEAMLPIPAGLNDPVVIAAIVLNYLTAYQMLHHVAKVPDGGRILIHGAAGGVGTAMLQLAALHGITVYGTASAAKHDTVRELGGIPIDYRRVDFVQAVLEREPGGLDAVFDPFGGGQLLRSRRIVRRSGTLVAFGIAGSRNKLGALGTVMLVPLLNLLPGKRATFYSISGDHPSYRADLAALLDLLAAGQIAPVIARRLPLAEAVTAHRLLEEAAVRGKIVLEMG